MSTKQRPTGQADGVRSELGSPQRYVPELLDRPPAPPKRPLVMLDQPEARRPAVEPTTPDESQLSGPVMTTDTAVSTSHLAMSQPESEEQSTELLVARPAGTLVSFLGVSVLPNGQTSNGSTVNEPSVALGGKHVVYSGNWYFARSQNGGLTWSFIDPFADMPDFCCDQDVIYDRGRDLFIWYRQGVKDNTGKNRSFLSASTDGGKTWLTYIFTPSVLNGVWTTNQGFDFPQLALTDNYVYLHTGMTGTGVPQTAVLRLPLDALAAGTGFQFWWWGQVSYWGGPVHGATTAMYFGDHQGASNSFRIYRQLETETGISWHDAAIPGWLLEQGGNCPAKDGVNWCVRSDSVVRAGWVANGTIGFMWHARAGNGFPFPYVEAAIFKEDDFSHVGRPYIWNNSGAWHYPFASPNARGDVAVTAFFSDPTSFPSPCFLLHDDYSPQDPPPWEAYRLFSGSASAVWGDFVRNRAFQPSQLGWVTSAWIAQASTDGPQAVPLYYILCRQRDNASVGRYWQA